PSRRKKRNEREDAMRMKKQQPADRKNTGSRGARPRLTRVAGAAVVVLGLTGVSACGAADTGSSSSKGSSGKVTIAVPSWVGAEANGAVAKYILENELDTKAELKQLDESVAFDALHSGKVDAIMEDWGGAPKKVQLYVEENKSVVAGGDLGVVGRSEEHTSELQSRENLVCRLLLAKKKI